MSGAAHTPGPWTVGPGNPAFDRARYPTSANVLVYADDDCESHPIADCSCNHSCRMDWDCEANARLIAAAPDLLAALSEVMRGYFPHATPNEYQELAAARAAIAKATGK